MVKVPQAADIILWWYIQIRGGWQNSIVLKCKKKNFYRDLILKTFLRKQLLTLPPPLGLTPVRCFAQLTTLPLAALVKHWVDDSENLININWAKTLNSMRVYWFFKVLKQYIIILVHYKYVHKSHSLWNTKFAKENNLQAIWD